MSETASNSAATRKETNRTRVIRQALACFVDRGIEATRVSDVAALAGLTERSAFRYFEPKADLVLETALLFWQEAMAHGRTAEGLHETEALCGAAQIFPVLQGYAELYFTHRQELIFVHEAEAYLYRHGKALLMRSRPPAPFEACQGPLSRAIHRGMADGSVRTDVNLAHLYDSTYDALLGLIQKMAIGERQPADAQEDRARLNAFCRLLADAYCSG